MICDRWQQPFVIGVHYVEGEYAAAAQPDVAMVSQGVRLDVNPQVIDAETLDLGCVATSSTVDEVGTVKIPGQDVTVQAPLVSRQSIAARCRLAPGEALLIAPLAGRQSDAAQPIDQELYVISAEWFLGSGFGGDVPVGKKAVIDEAVGAPRTEPADANKAASSSP